MPTKRTIVVSGEGLRREAEAAGAITPGDLIITNSAGKFIRHATAKAQTERLFAIEPEHLGKGTDQAYASTDRVLAESCHSGMMVNVSIAASAAAIVIGDQLESTGDGTLRKLTDGIPLAIADEACDNSGGGSKTWCRARII